ncbi:MAG TPA: hypothetical protein VK972_00045 [Wenzhouxiangella sp.]|nr:hypothetical protein [Wenzhouxiangella sp.]
MAFLMGSIWTKVIAAGLILALIGGAVLKYQTVAAERDLAENQLAACQRTNEQNAVVIEAMQQAELENERLYRAQIERSERLADELAAAEARREEETDEIVEQIIVAADGDTCAGVDMPPDVRMLLTGAGG